MAKNLYIITRQYVPKQEHLSKAKRVSNKLVPFIKSWAYPYFSYIFPVGSFAKGTSIIGNTDIDLFISLKATLPGTLEANYKNLADWMRIRNFSVREQNVSIRVNYEGLNIDLIPGRRQPKSFYDHSVYCSRRNTWTKTNVQKHIRYVKSFNRKNEIRVIKIWRNLNKLEFPSFYLELSTIKALHGSLRSMPIPSAKILARNVQKVFEYLYNDFLDEEIVDPSNSNNIISEDLSKKEKQAIKHGAYSALIATYRDDWDEIIW